MGESSLVTIWLNEEPNVGSSPELRSDAVRCLPAAEGTRR